MRQLEQQVTGFYKYGADLKSLHKNIKKVEANGDYNEA